MMVRFKTGGMMVWDRCGPVWTGVWMEDREQRDGCGGGGWKMDGWEIRMRVWTGMDVGSLWVEI